MQAAQGTEQLALLCHFLFLEGTKQQQGTRCAAQTRCRRAARGRTCATHFTVATRGMRAKSFLRYFPSFQISLFPFEAAERA